MDNELSMLVVVNDSCMNIINYSQSLFNKTNAMFCDCEIFLFFPLFGFSLFLRELPALSHNLVALCALTSILHILVVFCVRLERFHIAQYGERP